MTKGFEIAPQLAADTTLITRGQLSDFRLMDDTRFPWIILVPRKPHVVELFDLVPGDRTLLIEEAVFAARALETVTGLSHMNTGALGNIVRQFHWHVVARQDGDDAWPGPVWGVGKRVPYDSKTRQARVDLLREALPSYAD